MYRRDGRDQPGGDKEGAIYFVLDITHDSAAWRALHAYVQAVWHTHRELAYDLNRLLLETDPL